ncbi:hypothetical protein WA026_011437 [Henosepilachna vigintioctopunctata]
MVEIGSQRINYMKVGTGKTNVLCFPGALGTIWSDFKPQIEGLDRSKFTIVAWDPPGHGYSRPPERLLTSKFYEEDADTAHALMRFLGIKSFSLLGWSDGGISGLILAAKYPEVVDKLIVWGSNSFVMPTEVEGYEKLRNIKNWSEKARAPLIELYGEKTLQDIQNSWVDAMQEINQKGGNICKSILKDIRCPTLILHGDKDPLVDPEHPKYLLENIKGSKIHRFTEGKHNIHLRYAKEFNNIVTNFLLNSEGI